MEIKGSNRNNFRKHEDFRLEEHSQQYQVVWLIHYSENFVAWRDGWYWYENSRWKQSAEKVEISYNFDVWITTCKLRQLQVIQERAQHSLNERWHIHKKPNYRCSLIQQ